MIIWEITDAPTEGFDIEDADAQELWDSIVATEFGSGCGPSYSTIAPLPDGSEDISGCTWGIYGITLDHNEQYQLVIKGTSPVVLTVYDTPEGVLPLSFTYADAEWSDFGLPAPMAQPGFPIWFDPFLATYCRGGCELYPGVGSGNFISAAINEVPEPTSVSLLAVGLIAVAAFQVLRRSHVPTPHSIEAQR